MYVVIRSQPEEEEEEEAAEEHQDVEDGKKRHVSEKHWNNVSTTPSECLISCLWGDLSACNMFSCPGGEPESPAALTPEQMEQLRLDKIKEKKLHIAGLGSAIVSDPYSNVRPLSAPRSHTSLLHHRCVCVVMWCIPVCVCSGEASEGTAWDADGGGALCGGDRPEAGHGFSDGDL